MLPYVIGAGLALAANEQNRQSQSKQIDAMKRAQALINDVPLPILKEYYPELYQQVVSILPEAETYQALGQSEMQNVQVDPRTIEAQMNALAGIQDIAAQGGMTATDRARLAQIQSENEAQLKGQQGAIMQNLAARGMSGGMSELVARQTAAQQAANRQAQQGLDVAAQAEQRALQALMQYGQLGGQIGQQQFSQAAAKAQAADEIAKFNAANLASAQQRNIAARNAAQAANAQMQQQIAGQNVGLRNQAQLQNQSLAQQQYQNQLARATGQSGSMQNIAAQQAANQAQQNQFYGGLLQTGAQLYAGQQQAQQNQENFNKMYELQKQRGY